MKNKLILLVICLFSFVSVNAINQTDSLRTQVYRDIYKVVKTDIKNSFDKTDKISEPTKDAIRNSIDVTEESAVKILNAVTEKIEEFWYNRKKNK